jgi:hypothetical protein
VDDELGALKEHNLLGWAINTWVSVWQSVVPFCGFQHLGEIAELHGLWEVGGLRCTVEDLRRWLCFDQMLVTCYSQQ